MKTLTVCTANMHNMFVLYRAGFKAPGQFHYEEVPKGFRYLPPATGENHLLCHPDSRGLAALALKRGRESLPDVAIFQEVESMAALDLFNKSFLDGAYPYTLFVAGHYERLTSVGVMSMHPIISIRSHKDEKDNKGLYIFRRDCLEVVLDVEGVSLTVFANHFKSHFGKTEEEREAAEAERSGQAHRVAEILKERFDGDLFKKAAFVVMGDLNDAPGSQTLAPFIKLGMEDVITRLPESERWTYYWAAHNIVSQFDYILLSPVLSRSSWAIPFIERRGLPKGKRPAFLDSGKGTPVSTDFVRFPGVDEKVFASDHAFIFFSISMPHQKSAV